MDTSHETLLDFTYDCTCGCGRYRAEMNVFIYLVQHSLDQKGYITNYLTPPYSYSKDWYVAWAKHVSHFLPQHAELIQTIMLLT